jgi:hypothetical protein
LIEYIVQCHHAIPSYGWWQSWEHNFEGVADVAIERFVDRAIDVGAHFVVILIPIKFTGDADGLLASILGF